MSLSLWRVEDGSSPTTACSMPTSKLCASASVLSSSASTARVRFGGGHCLGESGGFVRSWAGDESSAKKRRFLVGRSSGCGDSIRGGGGGGGGGVGVVGTHGSGIDACLMFVDALSRDHAKFNCAASCTVEFGRNYHTLRIEHTRAFFLVAYNLTF